ncbi:MAG: DUF5076 domain-containing protein, partial [Mesorhizobium sp.]
PYTAADAKGLLKAAIRDPNPVIFLENEILYGQSFDVPKIDDFVLPIGKARIHKSGTDVTIVSFGIGMSYTVKAEAELRGMGIDAEIIDLRTIRPLDFDTIIASVKKTNRLVVVEEGFPQSSVGDHIASQVSQRAFDFLDAPVITWIGSDAVVTMQDLFGPNAHNWGMVLADVGMHIARMRLEQDGIPEIETLQALEEGYRGRMSEQFNIQHRSLTGRN